MTKVIHAHKFLRVNVQRPVSKKKAVNLSIDEELLSDCKELGINLSLVLEERLKEIRRAAIKAQIAAYVKYENEQIDEYGIWSEGARAW